MAVGKQYEKAIEKIKKAIDALENPHYKVKIKDNNGVFKKKYTDIVLVKKVSNEELKSRKLSPSESGDGWVLYVDDGMVTIYYTKGVKVKIKVVS